MFKKDGVKLMVKNISKLEEVLKRKMSQIHFVTIEHKKQEDRDIFNIVVGLAPTEYAKHGKSVHGIHYPLTCDNRSKGTYWEINAYIKFYEGYTANLSYAETSIIVDKIQDYVVNMHSMC